MQQRLKPGTAAPAAAVLPQRPHLILCGWYRPGTGFTRVLEALLPALCARFAVTWLGVGYHGPAAEHPSGARLLPTNLHGGDVVGAVALRAQWAELAPQLLLVMNDLWYLQHYSREVGELAVASGVPMVGYLPLDGRAPPPAMLSALRGYRCLYTYTRSAAADLLDAGAPMPVRVLGHGVDRNAFSPAIDPHGRDPLLARMRLAQRHFQLDRPAFVVLNAARPDPRKHLQRTLEGFARFASHRDDAYLCLHHAFAAPEIGADLQQLTAALDLQQRILYHPSSPGVVDDATLNRLYNACAVGINTAYGEGFGLVSFEHAACGAPQLLPDQDALRELWADSAVRLPAQPVRWPGSPLQMVDVDRTDIAGALARLRDDPAHYRHMAQAALQRARAPDLDWHTLAAQLATQLAVMAEMGAG